jgi:hypothetical protein
VILGLTWWNEAEGLADENGHRLDDSDNRAIIAALDDLIDQLRGAGKQVILIGPLAQPRRLIASEISRELAFGRRVDVPTFVPESDFDRRFGAAIQHFETRGDIDFARPDQVQCHAERCDYLLDGRSLFADESHVAVAELPRFRTVFQTAFAAQATRLHLKLTPQDDKPELPVAPTAIAVGE